MTEPLRVSSLLNTNRLTEVRKNDYIQRIDNISRLIGDVPFGVIYSKDIRTSLELSGVDADELAKWTKIESWGDGEIVHVFEPMKNPSPRVNREIARRRLVKHCSDLTYNDLFLKPRRYFTHDVITAVEYARQAGVIPFIGRSDKCCAVSEDEEVSCDDSEGETFIITPTGSCAIGSDCCDEC